MFNKSILLIVILLNLMVYWVHGESKPEKSTSENNIDLSGVIINSINEPVKNARIYLMKDDNIYCLSDSSGNFHFTGENMVNQTLFPCYTEKVYQMGNFLYMNCNNEKVVIDIYDLLGRKAGSVNRHSLTGTYTICPLAYISSDNGGIYIVRVSIGNSTASFKFQYQADSDFSAGFEETNQFIALSLENLKSTTDDGDSLVIQHDFYKTKKIALNNLNADLGTIVLENFAEYQLAEGFEAVSSLISPEYSGGFNALYSADSVFFLINFDSLSLPNGELLVKAIPISGFEGLPQQLKFISGIHFEPSGTQLFQPAEIMAEFPDNAPDSLVVFVYNDQNEIFYYPHYTYSNYAKLAFFKIYHFSGVGIATGAVPEQPGINLKSADEYRSYIRFLISISGGTPIIPDKVFSDWFNYLVNPMIAAISTVENLEKAYLEFLILWQTHIEASGLLINQEDFTELEFYSNAITGFSEKMQKLVEQLDAEYENITDMCEKIKIAALVLRIAQIGNTNDGFYKVDLKEVCKGETLEGLPNKVIIKKTWIESETDKSFQLEFAVLNSVNDTLNNIQNLRWNSSNPAVACINENGLVNTADTGKTNITCDLCNMKANTTIVVTNKQKYCTEKFTGVFFGNAKLVCRYEPSLSLTSEKITKTTNVTIKLYLTDKGEEFSYGNYYLNGTESCLTKGIDFEGDPYTHYSFTRIENFNPRDMIYCDYYDTKLQGVSNYTWYGSGFIGDIDYHYGSLKIKVGEAFYTDKGWTSFESSAVLNRIE
ncbi:MAG: Ig-like domain-containing protein [Bacteroidales bacterium]|nr:Ig-like domain-containing protein [Bacteroidales bacterium]